MIDKMSFYLTDGATILSGLGITDYAICGMGGELIADIIERAPHFKDSRVNLILQPMSRQSVLRKYLVASGFEIKTESYSYDAGKYYVCLLATYTGNSHEIDETEAELGIKSAEYINDRAREGYVKTLLAARLRASEGKRLGGMTDIPEEGVIRAAEELLNILSQEGTNQ